VAPLFRNRLTRPPTPAWNGADLGPDAQYAYVLLAFLSYKVAVLDQAWKALKAVTVFARPDSDRPVLLPLPDATRDLKFSVASSLVPLSLALLLVAAPAEAVEACQAKCVKACLAIAPKSEGYCKDNCAAECRPGTSQERAEE